MDKDKVEEKKEPVFEQKKDATASAEEAKKEKDGKDAKA